MRKFFFFFYLCVVTCVLADRLPEQHCFGFAAYSREYRGRYKINSYEVEVSYHAIIDFFMILGGREGC